MAGAETPESGQAPGLLLDGVLATITLRRPQVANRLSLADLRTLRAHLAAVDADPAVRVLRLQAEGRHFCAGFHIGEVGSKDGDGGDSFQELADALERLRPVTVAAVQGGTYGGAVDLALACDFRIGTPSVQAQVPAARLGIHYYRSGLERMVARLGLPAARRLMLAVEKMDAPTLLAIGWLDRIVSAETLAAEVDAFCRHLASLAPLALLPMKRHLSDIARGRLDAAAIEADIARALASEDLREGARAWGDKRTPEFRGR
jgi:enoyl-CoA hydratase